MNKARLFKVVNAALILSAIVQFTTVVMIMAHIKAPNARMVFEIHEHNGIVMCVLIMMHVMLNWGWIKANFLKVHK